MPDLLEEAKRLSAEVRNDEAQQPGDWHEVTVRLAECVAELVERLEQAERALDEISGLTAVGSQARIVRGWKASTSRSSRVAELVERLEQAERALDEISGLTAVGSQVWEIANASLEALAAQQRVAEQ